jgi:hypothetical protein
MSKVMSKPANQLFEDGFADICLAVFKLRKEGKHQEAYDGLGQVIKLLSQDRQELRKLIDSND